ncbi:hypothetical protein JKP88DRAFT_248152 [Tribonema minus]|uniref:Uncharacterized protein n=1 Tax=Tribonema minus TaxID=303371 RepID=A0A835YN14_9STRA|nr:hypothetical protein JKP88DRAFT_248152 [Tribonema minus]
MDTPDGGSNSDGGSDSKQGVYLGFGSDDDGDITSTEERSQTSPDSSSRGSDQPCTRTNTACTGAILTLGVCRFASIGLAAAAVQRTRHPSLMLQNPNESPHLTRSQRSRNADGTRGLPLRSATAPRALSPLRAQRGRGRPPKLARRTDNFNCDVPEARRAAAAAPRRMTAQAQARHVTVEVEMSAPRSAVKEPAPGVGSGLKRRRTAAAAAGGGAREAHAEVEVGRARQRQTLNGRCTQYTGVYQSRNGAFCGRVGIRCTPLLLPLPLPLQLRLRLLKPLPLLPPALTAARTIHAVHSHHNVMRRSPRPSVLPSPARACTAVRLQVTRMNALPARALFAAQHLALMHGGVTETLARLAPWVAAPAELSAAVERAAAAVQSCGSAAAPPAAAAAAAAAAADALRAAAAAAAVGSGGAPKLRAAAAAHPEGGSAAAAAVAAAAAASGCIHDDEDQRQGESETPSLLLASAASAAIEPSDFDITSLHCDFAICRCVRTEGGRR